MSLGGYHRTWEGHFLTHRGRESNFHGCRHSRAIGQLRGGTPAADPQSSVHFNLDLSQAQRLSGWRPDLNLPKIILVERAATKEQQIPYKAPIPTPFTETLSWSSSKSDWIWQYCLHFLFQCWRCWIWSLAELKPLTKILTTCLEVSQASDRTYFLR